MTLNGWFVFGSFDTRSLGVTVVPDDLEQAPAREFQVIPTPGRNGNILVDNKKYPNVERTYWVLISANFASVYRQLREALLSVSGYARLTDAWNPDEFYEAYVSADLDTVVSRNREMGKVLVTFSRKPQRFLVSGEEQVTFSTGGVYITNPTRFETRPLIHCGLKDGATVDSGLYIAEINDSYVEFVYPEGTNIFEDATYVDIDTAARKVTTDGLYPDITSYVRITDGIPMLHRPYLKDFRSLTPGRNYVHVYTVAVDYTKAYVIPRWYTI